MYRFLTDVFPRISDVRDLINIVCHSPDLFVELVGVSVDFYRDGKRLRESRARPFTKGLAVPRFNLVALINMIPLLVSEENRSPNISGSAAFPTHLYAPIHV